MPTVIAAVDGSATAGPVLAYAKAFADASAMAVRAVHVSGADDDHEVDALARHFGVPVSVRHGNVIDALIAAINEPDVAVAVIGSDSRLHHGGIGHVTCSIMRSGHTPLLIVPAHATTNPRLRRVLVPLDGTDVDARTVAGITRRLVQDAGTELTMIHVFDEQRMPPVANHEPHETDAWVHEFRTRYAPTKGTLVFRVGTAAQEIAALAHEQQPDLAILAWTNHHAPHTGVTQTMIGQYPILLVPENPPSCLSAGPTA